MPDFAQCSKKLHGILMPAAQRFETVFNLKIENKRFVIDVRFYKNPRRSRADLDRIEDEVTQILSDYDLLKDTPKFGTIGPERMGLSWTLEGPDPLRIFVSFKEDKMLLSIVYLLPKTLMAGLSAHTRLALLHRFGPLNPKILTLLALHPNVLDQGAAVQHVVLSKTSQHVKNVNDTPTHMSVNSFLETDFTPASLARIDTPLV